MFKQDLIDQANWLASWTLDEDCYGWVRVVCDNVTNHVPPPINLNRSSLAILDLSSNSFENAGVVDFSWIFHLKSLVSLDLSHNDLKGRVFDGLANMTSLRHLDLSFNAFNSSIPEWLYNLNSLQFLNLGSNSLKGLISSAIGNMSSAISLDFSENELEGVIPKSRGNLCNLKSIVFTSVNLSQDWSFTSGLFQRVFSRPLQ
ncbi:hypothetical protein SCA6_015993 [Theobroma cacao]